MSSTTTMQAECTKVPFVDLKAQIGPIKDEILQAMESVWEKTAFANGPAVAQFEKQFTEYCQVSECVAVNSGTSALHVAMRCLDIGPDDGEFSLLGVGGDCGGLVLCGIALQLRRHPDVLRGL